ncbi:MAG: hypothetical protein ACXACD_10295, partial [Candidatus Thorarchaeota archaeon]
MANTSRNFVLGRMNKSLDERLVPNGEYVDALNVRLGSTEDSEVGSVENSKGNTQLTTLSYRGLSLSNQAKCIGAYEDGANETLYWFVHDPAFSGAVSPTGKLDLVVSLNVQTNVLTYHIISINDGGNVNTVLNFDQQYLITGVNLVDNELLFWTDDYNPPRFININRNYPNPVGTTDGIIAEDILVIKKPPVNSLTVTPISTSSQNNFLEDRFVSFGYRYRYEDGEYSATSQFSNPSFLPGAFRYDFATGGNTGMLNITNVSNLTYNSGGPLVKGIDLLWKDMQTGSIRVIEKLNKDDLGLLNNTDYTYTFSNSKIFTVLPESEILRLYDNVPRLAKAQTMMGNRLVYGNYLEQYDIVTLGGFPTKLEYTTDLVSEAIGLEAVPDTASSGTYNVDGVNTVVNAIFALDFNGINLVAGAVIDIQFRFEHFNFTGPNPPTATTAETEINFQYILNQDFASAYDLATSVDFTEKIGTIANIQTVANCGVGTTLTDLFNCSVPTTLDALEKFESGINTPNEPIAIITSPSSTEIGFQLPFMRYVDDPLAITQWAYEYYSTTFVSATYQSVGNPKSLHSNRSYEVGIIYMDEFNRATTALVSENNTVYVPCSLSDLANKIRVTIPTTQLAPSWATRYKFAVKADKENYFTVYSSLFFRDPTSSADYFLLEGQNTRKVEEGDLLIVKADTNGALTRCAYASVLEKKAQSSDFLDPPPVDATGTEIPVPAGVYMKIRATQFATTIGDLPVVNYGEISDSGNGCREVDYPVDREDPAAPGTYIDYTIPAGSRITIVIDNNRRGNLDSFLGNVPPKKWFVDATFTASQEYANFKDWFDGDNIAPALEAQAVTDGTGVTGPNYNNVLNGGFQPCGVSNISCYFDDTGTRTEFRVRSSEGYSGKKKEVTLKVSIEVIRSTALMVFETEPQDALPDVWYESSVSYPIDTATGYHEGNVQNQTGSTPAIIDTQFFNCYAFGNGVESYQIRDFIDTKELLLGNRVTTTSAQDYGEIRRFADLTYSGVYNDESNVNKLNEFNLGLLNFKPLEDSYGPVYRLDGRETDILTLQEDKISFVLAGKNLLTDSTGESTVASVPQVLGTQVARTEEYGISFHPESYAKWGYDKFFTDAKRGAVIQLKGTAGQNEQLSVISEAGMRSWFRDLFLESFNTQKLGGYDPYMNEFVLSSNDELLPSITECIECGISRTLLVNSADPSDFCVDVGYLVGEAEVEWNVISGDVVTVTATYNSTAYLGEGLSGSVLVDKDTVSVDTMDINVTTLGTAEVQITVNCPEAQTITIIQVCFSNDNEAGQFIHNEYRWVDGAYISPLHSAPVELVSGATNPLVSQYDVVSGPQGAGFIPADGATISIISNKIAPIDDFVFNPSTDGFKYLRSATLYNNTPVDMAALLAAANDATPITGSAPTYEAAFTMPTSNDQYLYLIYNYRNATRTDLCYSTIDEFDACCNCATTQLELKKCEHDPTAPITTVISENNLGVSVGQFVEIDTDPGCVYEVVALSEETATASLTAIRADITDCTDVCLLYRIESSAPTQDAVVIPCGYSDAITTLTLLDCQCPDTWIVERCDADGVTQQEVIDGGGLITTGDFVSLASDPDCRYEVLYQTSLGATDVLNAVETDVTNCAQVCNYYTITNFSGGALTVNYNDCGGLPQTTPLIENGGTFDVCATQIANVVGTSITFVSCTCPTNLLVRQCRIDGIVNEGVIDNSGGATIGDFIFDNSDPQRCYWQVVSNTNDPVTIVDYIVEPLVTDCTSAPVCF